MKLHALVPFSSQEEATWPNDGGGWREGKTDLWWLHQITVQLWMNDSNTTIIIPTENRMQLVY